MFTCYAGAVVLVKRKEGIKVNYYLLSKQHLACHVRIRNAKIGAKVGVSGLRNEVLFC